MQIWNFCFEVIHVVLLIYCPNLPVLSALQLANVWFLYSLCGEAHIGPFPHRIRTCNVAGSLASKEHSWEKGVTEHVLPLVESFHLYDRLGRAVSHEERLQVDRIPAIVELCIQAGVDILDYPTRRRTVPVYNIAGKIIDFERKFPKDDTSGKDIQAFGFWERRENTQDSNSEALPTDDMQGLSQIYFLLSFILFI